MVLKGNFPILIGKFNKHHKIKKNLLNLLKETNSETLKSIDNYYSDKISRLDWYDKTNWERKWVKYIINDLINHFKNQIKKINLLDVVINALWFQQYNKTDIHSWHVHGENYTGVYYVEFDEKCPATQLIDPITNKLIKIKIKEGDIIMFPSFVIHRAPLLKEDTRKTIISFNLTFNNIQHKFLKNLIKKYSY
jgi:hypothetical protein